MQRGLNFAIVDEVDSILIDEARTPLIISGQAEDHTDLYVAHQPAGAAARAQSARKPRTGEDVTKPGDYTVDEKGPPGAPRPSRATRTPKQHPGRRPGLLPEGASLYDPANIAADAPPQRRAARPRTCIHRDQHYVVQNGEVVIVDEFTGRLMPGRRWSDGLHQAVEAKEGVRIQAENQTLASITFQNYFRMYGKLVGHDRHGRHRGLRVPARSTAWRPW